MRKKKKIDQIPEEFESSEAASEFWDAHDTTDYPEFLRSVTVVSQLRRRRFEIEIEPDVLSILETKARKKGVTVGRLAGDLLRRQLAGPR
jgi:hypothetical protein